MLTPISKATDFLCISTSAYVSQIIVFHDHATFTNVDGLLGLLGLVLPFITFQLTRVYRPFRYDSAFNSAFRALLGWFLAQFILTALSHGYPGREIREQWLLWWTVIAACTIIVGRLAVHALPLLLRSRRFAPPRIAIVAPFAANGDLLERIAPRTRNAFVPEVIFDPSLPMDTIIDHIPAVRELNTLKQIVRTRKLMEIWIINSPFEPISVEHLFDEFRDAFINIRVLPMSDGNISNAAVMGDYRGVPILNIMAAPDRGWDVVPKELFDRIFSFCVLLLISPLLMAIAIAVKLSSPGPVLFRQHRKGMNGDVFSIYKFRTMFHGADKPGTVVQARKGDSRVTKVGRFLRSTSLDELPQFFNVLKGEMSVVGPRPHAVEHDEYYKELVQHYMFRYRIKPGITGWAQINGHRGETAQLEQMEARVRFDMHYIQHWTFWFDMKIIALTIFKGFVGNGAY